MIPFVRDTVVQDTHCVTVHLTETVRIDIPDVDYFYVKRITFTWVRDNGSPIWEPCIPDMHTSDWDTSIERSQLPQWVLDLESEFKPRNPTT